MATPSGAHSSPFAPQGLEWTGVSPRLITSRLITVGVWLGIPTIVCVVLAVVISPWVWIPAGVLAVIVGTLVIVIPRQVRAIGYAERADDLLIRKGVMFQSMVVVPYGRMQYIDVQAGPLDRSLGIAKVQLHTASTQTDANVAGLVPEEAERLRERLASRGEARLAGL